MNGFTTVDIGCEKGNNLCNIVTRLSAPESEPESHLDTFEEL